MNKRIKYLIVIFWTIVHLSSIAQGLETIQPEKVGMSSKRLDRLTETLQEYVDDGKLSGAVALVARRGKVAYFHAVGSADMESKAPMTKTSIFRIASQSKAIVSVGVMMLQEDGKLLISDPVGKYLPEYSKTTVAVAQDDGSFIEEDATRQITIRDLLTHTAGIGYGGGPAASRWEEAGIQGWYFADRDEPIRETVSRMPEQPFSAQPGEAYVYGYNTDILGALIEVVAKESLDKYLKRRILDPLGMTDTHFYLPEDKSSRLAAVYSVTETGLQRAPDPGGMVGQGAYIKGPRKSFSGGAGFLSTAEDYARFLQMMLDGGSFNGHQILSKNTVELMTVNHLQEVEFPWAAGTGFGLGFSVVTDVGARGVPGSLGEYGWGGAYHSTYWVDPKEDLVVVYFTQIIPANGLDDQGKLRALVYQALVE